jgi:hypothetical protein
MNEDDRFDMAALVILSVLVVVLATIVGGIWR